MKFYSTRDRKHEASFREAIFRGLAPDGGLYHPSSEPDLKGLFLDLPEGSSFVEIASRVIPRLLPDTFTEESAASVCQQAFSFEPALAQITPEMQLLELFHGPSCAFKDFGASFLAAAMEHLLEQTANPAIILTATSGDTGSAVAKAFHHKAGIEVVILYPSGRVSPLQEKQLTTVGGNVTALEVAGSFDDCQRMVKQAFMDPVLRQRLRLTSANSINLGRLLPQALYYIYAFVKLRSRLASELVFCVPSGNFGNLTAGILAWRWGLPVSGFIAATNINDVVPEYLLTGIFTPRPSRRTLANAMDVGNPSNFERMLEVFGSDYEVMREVVSGEAVDDRTIAEVMSRYHVKYNRFLDPHTAAGVAAAERYLDGEGASDAAVVTLATAHAAKFAESVREATGAVPDLPPQLAGALEREKQATPVAAELDALRNYLLGHYDTDH